MNDQHVSNAAAARQVGVDRTTLSKVRHGERSINPRMLNGLVDLLKLDRDRLALAVQVMDNPSYYFDPQFKNASYVAVTFLKAAMSVPKEETGAIALTSLSKESCELLAHRAMQGILDKFATADGMQELAAKLFGGPAS